MSERAVEAGQPQNTDEQNTQTQKRHFWFEPCTVMTRQSVRLRAAIGHPVMEPNSVPLIFGFAADENGQKLITGIAEYTLADVAASANLSGPTHLGGDNILEFSTGNITTSVIDVGSLNEVLWSSIADDIEDSTLENLPNEGKKNILMICPGFASDCVETLEEINIQGRETFMNCGGEHFEFIPCLNDNSDHIHLLESLVKKYLI